MWILFVVYVSCLSCCLFCSLQSCGHVLGKGWPLGSLVCGVSCVFVIFPCGVLDQVWYLIVSIPDLWFFPYSVHKGFKHKGVSFGGKPKVLITYKKLDF